MKWAVTESLLFSRAASDTFPPESLSIFRKMDKQLIYKAHYGPADGPFKILLKKY